MIEGKYFDKDLLICDKNNDKSLIWCAKMKLMGFKLIKGFFEDSTSSRTEYFVRNDKLIFDIIDEKDYGYKIINIFIKDKSMVNFLNVDKYCRNSVRVAALGNYIGELEGNFAMRFCTENTNAQTYIINSLNDADWAFNEAKKQVEILNKEMALKRLEKEERIVAKIFD